MPQKRTRTTGQAVAVLVLSLVLVPNATHAQTTATKSTSSDSTAAPTSTPTTAASPSDAVSAPTAFLGVASVLGDGKVFYQGGQLNTATVQYSSELMALDVTQKWTISDPVWINLTMPTSGHGGPAVSGHSAAISTDLSTLYLTAPTGNSSDPFFYEYNINAGTWSTDNAPAAQAVAWSTRKAAKLLTDTSTGALWYIGGNSGGTETNEIDKFLGGSWNANIPTTSSGGDAGSAAVMNKFSSGTAHIVGTKIFIFGGFSSSTGSRSYQSFQSVPWIDISTATPTIGTMLTLGQVPPPRQDHCSVLTASKKVIIFGGYDANARSTFSDLWSLDLVTLTWQQITPVNPARPRFAHTCDLIGANMVVFGGRATSINSTSDTGYQKDIQVYDVMAATWLDNYAPKKDTTPISKPLPGGVGSGSSGRLSTGALAGIIIAAVVLIVCVIGAAIYRKRQKSIEIIEDEMEKEAYLASLGADGDGDSSRGDHQRRDAYRKHKNNPYAASAATTSPRSGSRKRLTQEVAYSPDISHYGVESVSPKSTRRDYDQHELSYTGPSEIPGNVQYLMQQLPDGTIAVQPVYLDHQSIPLQHSPNMVYSETGSLSGFLGTPRASPAIRTTGIKSAGQSMPSAGYFAPPPPAHSNGSASPAMMSAGFVPPPSESSTGNGHNTTLPAAAHDPFASPILTPSQAQWLSSSPSSPRSQVRASLKTTARNSQSPPRR